MTVLQQIKQKHKLSGGHCGTYIIHFSGKLKAIKKTLNKLFKDGKITIHDGIHGKLVKLKTTK